MTVPAEYPLQTGPGEEAVLLFFPDRFALRREGLDAK